mgnify:CR=1 FL=1
MFNFIPIEYYTPIWYNTMLIIILFAFIKLQTKGYIIYNPKKKEYASLLLLLIVSLYMGLRPISGIFIDMKTYNYRFEAFAGGREVNFDRDVLWALFEKFSSGIMTGEFFFFICALLYVVPLYKASKNWLGKDKYFLFLMLVCSFSFWNYGVNGIRNGVATSFFVLGLSYYKKRKLKWGLLILSYFIHGSMMIPIAAFVLTLFYKNPKHYLLGWLFVIPISVILGGLIEPYVMSLGIGGDRASYLTMDVNDSSFSSTGFRWDFLLYSASAVFAGYYFIIKKNFNDKLYVQLFNIYVTANAFWILVIRASFSNRFAYLSWFLMAVIIFYPFFKKQFFKKQQKVLAYTILLYFGFTYVMFLMF